MKKRADGRYKKAIYLGNDADGKRLYKYVYAKSKEELEAKAADIIYHVKNGIYADDKGLTVGSWASKWIDIYKTTVSSNTLNGYNNIIKNHIADIKDIKLQDLKKTDVQIAINKLSGHYDLQRRLKLTMNQMLEAAIDEGLVYKNVARNVVLPRQEKKEKRTLTEIEKTSIDNADFTLREKAFVYLLLHTGMRRGEALALTINDIDFTNDIIKINKSLAFGNNQSVVKSPKTKGSYREIDMLSKLKPVLLEYINTINTLYLFTNENGTTMSRMGYKRMWDSIYAKLNIAAGGKSVLKEREYTHEVDLLNGLTPHIFRHNFATVLYYAGVDVKDAQRILGHSDIKTTLNIYTHLDKNKSKSKSKLELYMAD